MGRLLSCCDEKGNDKYQTLKSVKVRSSANQFKGFMSPTISAALKFATSPRKKPLLERNEQVRTSISLSDGKATLFSAISSENTEDLVLRSEQEKVGGSPDSTVPHLQQNQAVIECPPASEAMKKVKFADSNKPSEQKKVGGSVDSTVTHLDQNQAVIECRPPSKAMKKLTFAESVPPYDPKVNYLSPRPQFLRYKPNPRIELLLRNKDKVLDSELNDIFSSAEIEESEVKEEDEKTIVGKRSFFTSMKFASLLLLFLIGIISIFVPVMNSSILKSSTKLHLPLVVADMAKANFDAAPVQQMEEPVIYVEVVSDNTCETGIDGKIELGNQELTSTPTSELQMKEPGSLETVRGQEGGASNDDAEVKSYINVAGEKSLEGIEEAKVSKIQPDLPENTKLEGATDLDDSGPKIESPIVADITPLEMVRSPIGASIVLLALISAAAYVYLNRGSSTTKKPDFEVHSDQLLSSRKIIPKALALEQVIHHHEQVPSSSKNWSREVVDVMEEESRSSEMSSFRTRPSSSHRRLMKSTNDEAQSQESRKLRKQSKRDSLTSSSEYSTGSPVYGRFTTYEKIISKNATSGDHEIMTRVRRSSRIRNLAASA